MFRNCALFSDYISKITNAKFLDVAMSMYSLIEYSDNYSKTSGVICQYNRDDPNDNKTNSEWFKFKAKITRRTLKFGNSKVVDTIKITKQISEKLFKCH